MIVARGVRGPASYTRPGFSVTFGEIQNIKVSSGRMAGVFCSTSTLYRAFVLSTSGNAVMVQVQDGSGAQIANATDLSGDHFFVIADGY